MSITQTYPKLPRCSLRSASAKTILKPQANTPMPCRATGGGWAAWYGQSQMGTLLVNNGGKKCKITVWPTWKGGSTHTTPAGRARWGGKARKGPSALAEEEPLPGLLLSWQRHGKTAANYFSYNLANYRWDLCCLTIDLKGWQKNLCGALQAFFSLCHGRILQEALLKPGLPLPCLIPCQQILSPTKGTDTHLIPHWTDPGAKVAHSGTRWALALVSKAHDRSSRKGRTEIVLSCHTVSCLCQDSQLMLPYGPGKNGFFNTKSIQVTPETSSTLHTSKFT